MELKEGDALEIFALQEKISELAESGEDNVDKEIEFLNHQIDGILKSHHLNRSDLTEVLRRARSQVEGRVIPKSA